MRIMHVYRTYFPDPPGGLQEAIRQIALSTTALGADNTVFTLSTNHRPPVLIRPEARVVRCRSWAAPASCDIGGIHSFSCFSKTSREADVLHYLFPWPFADVLHATIRREKPALLTYISDVVRQRWLATVYAPLMWKTLLSMRVIVANCPAYAKTSPVLTHRALREKVRVIPLGIDEASYPKDCDDGVFERVGIRSDEPFFLFLGVLRYYKGLDYLIRAAEHVDAPIVIAGSGSEAVRLNNLKQEVGARRVVFAGQVTEREKVALIRRCRALVLPSHLRSEAFGMVLVEAAMLGKPMVSCEIGTGTSFVNAHGQTGIVVPPADSSALSTAMHELLRDDVLAASMGVAARSRYERMFSGKALGRAYSDLFAEVCR